MIRIGNEYGIHALPRQMWIVGFAKHKADVVFASLECPEPQEHERQPADVLCQNLPLWPTGAESLSVKYPEPHPRSTDYVSGLQIQCLDNIGWPLPLVPFSLNDVQTRKGIKTLVSSID